MSSELAEIAERICAELDARFPDHAVIRQVLALAEEAGEFVGAYRRWAGMARRNGSWDDVMSELADVAITAYVTAQTLGIDLDIAVQQKTAKIFSRGWKEES